MLKKLLIALLIALSIWGIWFYTTHYRVYGRCGMQAEGYSCDLIKWVKNAKN